MKKVQLLMALMLFFSVSIWAEGEVKYSVKARTDLSDANQNGSIEIPDHFNQAGTVVKIYCKPQQGYGLSRGVYYAKKDKNGVYTETMTATCESTYPDDRANSSQLFSFVMPDGDVEVWAFFAPLRALRIHQAAGGKLEALYGLDNTQALVDSNLVWNVPAQPVKLLVKPDMVKGQRNVLVDVNLVNVPASYCVKTADTVTIYMPNARARDTVHVTPVFGRGNYHVNVEGDTTYVKAKWTPEAPQARDEVEVTLTAAKGYIPKDFSIDGCRSWWRVDKPRRDSLGRWTVVYRFKVDLQDVTLKVNHEQVYAIDINDTQNSGRLQTLIPELIPDYPGMARRGQQVPVLFKMPQNYSVSYTARDAVGQTVTPTIYHNALKNSFADQDMYGWKQTNESPANGLDIMVDTDSDGNKFWRCSLKNTLSQTVSLSSSKSGSYKVAAIASINPHYGRNADVSVVATGPNMAEQQLVVANIGMLGATDEWQTVFKMGDINAKATQLQFLVSGEAEDPNKQYSHEGPMFDDLCLLLSKDGKTIEDEDVLIFTMGNHDVTINYTPVASQGTVSVSAKEHATLTLRNSNTGEEGTSINAMTNDVIVVKGTADEGYAIYNVKYTKTAGGTGSDNLVLDSISLATREVTYHYIMRDDKDATITPVVDVQKVYVTNQYGGLITVSNDKAQEGDTVWVTVTPETGCKLKQIRTVPAGLVEFTAEKVDAAGSGRYSFVMPASYLKLVPEFVVPITTADQLTKIHQQYGEFNLAADLDLGAKWSKQVKLYGQFNGNGHRITFGGRNSLFRNVYANASVRHLYVDANVKGSDSYLGIITTYNQGIIEDCEVSGTLTNTERYSVAGGVAGQNGPRGGTISHCHVVLDRIDAPTVCGIAYQEAGSTISGNVFNGRFVDNDGHAYMISNDVNNSTIEDNCYVSNDGNERAEVGSRVTTKDPVELLDMVKDLGDSYPVFTASIKSRCVAYSVTASKPADVSTIDLSATTGVPGTVISGTLTVTGNNHLASIIVSAPDGSDPHSATFSMNTEVDYSKNTEVDYTFSFTLPEHDVLVTFKTAEGTLIHTVKQLLDISDKTGTYILARDLDLGTWDKKVSIKGKFYGDGHTIKYQASGSFKGLFFKIRKNALLKGLRVVGNVETEMDCAGIAYDNQGTISDCHFCGRISKIESVVTSMNRVAAIACNMGKAAIVDHCSATGELVSPSNQTAVDQSPLCVQQAAKVTNSIWVSSTQTDNYQSLLTQAEGQLQSYPVFAQGILDKISTLIVNGTDSIRVLKGETLPEITITDGQRFYCSSETQIGRIYYRRQAMNSLEQWVLPFNFDQILGDGTFEYHKTVEDNKMPDLGPGQVLTFIDSPLSMPYKANEPLLVKSDGDGMKTFELTNSEGPVTVHPTYDNHIKRYASVLDVGRFYATYDSIPAQTAKENLLYAWDVEKQEFVLSQDSVADAIQPFRFYIQFYNQEANRLETYEETWWAKNDYSSSTSRAAQRRASSVIADGWQPIFLDPRQPQSVTERMLNYYEVAYLADVRADVVDESDDASPSAVSLVYQLVDNRTDLPAALPLLVRAKRSDAQPLTDAKVGAELDSLLTQAWIQLLMEAENGEVSDSLLFEMPHYWCASSSNRLDIWPLPAPERYADLADFGCMMFEDNYFDQSFGYATSTDTRSTTPMSYCITVLNTDTYELLPLMGDRLYVEFIGASDATGIEMVKSEELKANGSETYNLSGQRVSNPTKGLYIVNGRKVVIK